MPSKPLAFGLLLAACIVAAAGGAYIATRQNAALVPAEPVEAAAQAANTPAATSQAPGQPAAQVLPSMRNEPLTSPAASPSPSARKTSVPATRSVVSPPRVETAPPAVPDYDPRQEAAAGAQAKPWPNSGTVTPAATTQPQGPPPVPVEAAAPSRDVQEPQTPQTEELIVPADSVLGLQLETSLNSERAQIEDRVDAKVTRDVRVGNRVAIPAGTRAIGSVVMVGRGGKVKDRASLAIKFNTLVLADSTRLAINTDAVYREGESPASKSAAKIGGAAVGGAILGAILGGGKGAAIGGSIGAAGGTTAVMAGDRATVVLPAGTLVTVRMLSPVAVFVEK